ncbi:hypothetical protein F5Y09DRAFT_312315, partial [Xylaria sp. FL1042]
MRHIETSSRDPSDGLASIESFIHGKRILSTLPPFHYSICCIPFYLGTFWLFQKQQRVIMIAQGVVDVLKQTPTDVAVMAPSIVAELSHIYRCHKPGYED